MGFVKTQTFPPGTPPLSQQRFILDSPGSQAAAFLPLPFPCSDVMLEPAHVPRHLHPQHGDTCGGEHPGGAQPPSPRCSCSPIPRDCGPQPCRTGIRRVWSLEIAKNGLFCWSSGSWRVNWFGSQTVVWLSSAKNIPCCGHTSCCACPPSLSGLCGVCRRDLHPLPAPPSLLCHPTEGLREFCPPFPVALLSHLCPSLSRSGPHHSFTPSLPSSSSEVWGVSPAQTLSTPSRYHLTPHLFLSTTFPSGMDSIPSLHPASPPG